MSKGKDFLTEIYGLDDPEDVRRFYDESAEEYDEILLSQVGYVSPQICAERFHSSFGGKVGLVADLGCGSGLAGEALAAHGYSNLVGVDFSAKMLAVAKDKGCYESLYRLDLNAPMPFDTDHFAAAISVGALGQHIPPPILDEITRVVASGGIICFSVNELAFETHGFRDKLNELEDRKEIESLHLKKEAYHLKEGIDGWVSVLRVL